MPFNWANSAVRPESDGTTASLYMYGPYLVPNSPTGSDASVNGKIYGTLTVYLHLRPEISKLHRGADLGSDLPLTSLGHQAGLSGERKTTLRSPSGD